MDNSESNENEVYHRSLFMTKTASMAWLDLQGVSSRKFTMNELAMRNVILPEHMQSSDTALSESNNILRRVHLQSITVEPGTLNQFPFPVGVRIAGFPQQEFNLSGDAYSFIIPGKTSIFDPQSIFESHGDQKLQYTWEAEYAKWDSSNLDTLMAMAVPESDVMLVHLDHPVLQMLERRPEIFGVSSNIFSASSTPNWKHVQKASFEAASKWIKKEILSRSSKTFDLSQFSLSFSKIDGTKWTDLSPSCFIDMDFDSIENLDSLNEVKSMYSNVLMQKPHTISIKLGIKYRL